MINEQRFEEKELFALKWIRCSVHGWHTQVVPFRNGNGHKPQPQRLVETDWFRRGNPCYYIPSLEAPSRSRTPELSERTVKANETQLKARIVSLSRSPGKVWILVDYSHRNGFASAFKHEWMLRLVNADSLSPLGAGIEPPPALPLAWARAAMSFDRASQVR
jgi:hypothetical protein